MARADPKDINGGGIRCVEVSLLPTGHTLTLIRRLLPFSSLTARPPTRGKPSGTYAVFPGLLTMILTTVVGSSKSSCPQTTTDVSTPPKLADDLLCLLDLFRGAASLDGHYFAMTIQERDGETSQIGEGRNSPCCNDVSIHHSDRELSPGPHDGDVVQAEVIHNLLEPDDAPLQWLNQVSSRSGRAIARQRPGRPAPDPTSATWLSMAMADSITAQFRT